MNLEENTKELIDLYLEYSGKTKLTVEEFLSFRKQAIKEMEIGIRNMTSHNQNEKEKDFSKRENTSKAKPREKVDLQQPIESSNIVVKNNTPSTNRSTAFEDLTESEFLRRMKSIED